MTCVSSRLVCKYRRFSVCIFNISYLVNALRTNDHAVSVRVLLEQTHPSVGVLDDFKIGITKNLRRSLHTNEQSYKNEDEDTPQK